jgi:hypothetical protein
LGFIAEISGEPVSDSLIDVWSSPEVLEVIITLSETEAYESARSLLDEPLQKCPEYLILTLSQVQVDHGSILIDELLTYLMTLFLGNHTHSIPVLRQLWDLN